LLLAAIKIAFMETVTIEHKPAQNRVKFLDDSFNAAAHPWQPGISPSCSDMKHKYVLLADACEKTWKSIPPKTHSINKSKRHGCAFISKTLLLLVNVV
jgi:hypothetical protein